MTTDFSLMIRLLDIIIRFINKIIKTVRREGKVLFST
jgi:hypothetical protein